MPPGAWHAVYTPINTLAVGGHFLTYECMAQTEVARFHDIKYSRQATNTSHEGIERTLARMSLALLTKESGE